MQTIKIFAILLLLSLTTQAQASQNILLEALKLNDALFIADIKIPINAEERQAFVSLAKDVKVHMVASPKGMHFTYFTINAGKKYELSFVEFENNNTYLNVYSKEQKHLTTYGISPQYVMPMYALAKKIANKYQVLGEVDLAYSVNSFKAAARNKYTTKEEEAKKLEKALEEFTLFHGKVSAEDKADYIAHINTTLGAGKWKLMQHYVVTGKEDEIKALDTLKLLQAYKSKSVDTEPLPVALPKEIHKKLASLLKVDTWRFADYTGLKNVKKFDLILKTNYLQDWGSSMEFIMANDAYFINMIYFPERETAILFEVPKEAFVNLGLIK